MKSRLIATAIIVITWMALDVLFHGVWLMSEYQATASLWRPLGEMKNGLMTFSSVVTALLFVLTYCQLVSNKSLKKGIKLGVLVGLIVATGASLVSYASMPITITITIGWFLSYLVNYSVAGLITGYFVKTDI